MELKEMLDQMEEAAANEHAIAAAADIRKPRRDPNAAAAVPGKPSTLHARFLIRKELGAGTFAAIYLADDTTSIPPKTVAIKRIKAPVNDIQLREVMMLQALERHPNIVRLLDYFLEDNHLHVVTEYATGGDLGGFTAMNLASATWSFSVAVRLMLDIADGLRFMHSKGIWHRDVKPANILINSEGKAMLADFGESRLFGAAAFDGTLTLGVGTPLYMPPEVLRVSDM
jgi:serine/threonine protein kinase